MHNILKGTNTNKLLSKFNLSGDCIYTLKSPSNVAYALNYSMYISSYAHLAKEPIDITEDEFNKVLVIYEMTGDLRLSLKSLIKD